MSSQVTTAFVQQYSANVQMLSQQMGSRLRDAVRVENITGKNAFFDQVGVATAQLRTSRHADTPQIDTPHARRRVSLADYEYADLIDDQDKVRMLIDPTSSYAQAAAAAMGRAMDDVIISAALGTAFTGETGSTSTSFAAANQIANGSADMSIAKLKSFLKYPPKRIPQKLFSEPPQCMPDYCKGEDTVLAYQNYYILEKSGFAKWTKREAPVFFVEKYDATRAVLGLHETKT